MTFESMPKTREAAQRLGAKKYFTGEPCNNGHIAPRYTNANGRCLECQAEAQRKSAGSEKRKTPEQMHREVLEIIAEKGGVLIDGVVTCAKSKIVVQCGAGHKPFTTHHDRLSQRKWCRPCYDEAKVGQYVQTIENLKNAAKAKGGECVSTEFRGVKEKYRFLCPKHGEFQMIADSLLNSDQWCNECWNERRGQARWTPYEDVKAYAEQRGGKLLTPKDEYEGLKTRVQLECANGHKWSAPAAQLRGANSWCPNCKYKGEQAVRAIFETSFGCEFPKVRPAFLRTKKGGYLELDGYNDERKLAFEYQGPLHDLPDQVERDKEKATRCAELGITLITVDYLKNPWPISRLVEVIRAAVPEIYKARVREPDGDPFVTYFDEFHQMASDRGGEFLGTVFKGMNAKYPWSCGNPGHPSWEAVYYNVRKGSWCPHCAGVAKLDIDKLRAFGGAVGLELLSESYILSRDKYLWRCPIDHEFEDTKSNIKQRFRNDRDPCPECAKQQVNYRKDMEFLSNFAEQVGLTIADTVYAGAGVPYTWGCENGHKFQATRNSIARRIARGLSACQKCAGTRGVVSIRDLQGLARARSGRCLSTEYVDAKALIDWECNYGHRFSINWNKTQQGRWCMTKGCPDKRRFPKY